MQRSFPILTTRRIYPRGIFGELSAFLKGATTLAEFEAEGCKYWEPNAAQWDKNKGRLRKYWDVGRIYGVQWRNFKTQGHSVDQLAMLIDGLRKDPASRRHIMTTWHPAELDQMCLPPCHILVQFNVVGEYLDCRVDMRSVDICLGLPSDLVLYGLLQVLVGNTVGLEPRHLIFHMGDTHVYKNHINQANLQLGREPTGDPGPVITTDCTVFDFDPERVQLINYNPQEPIRYAFN